MADYFGVVDPGAGDSPGGADLAFGVDPDACAFSETQVNALLFHLVEWGSQLTAEQIHQLTYRRHSIKPQFRTSTCWYDY